MRAADGGAAALVAAIDRLQGAVAELASCVDVLTTDIRRERGQCRRIADELARREDDLR